MATHQWNQYMAEPAVAPLAHHPRLTPGGGGVPIFTKGVWLGASVFLADHGLAHSNGGFRAMRSKTGRTQTDPLRSDDLLRSGRRRQP
ncbi:hypothetical protein [Paraburkholderia phenoliruptrix]|uniref:hypothetical protein n=1 Tax=Paraburkholderia phenoliruptrix TaxID=252970 RepID=UPI003D974307